MKYKFYFSFEKFVNRMKRTGQYDNMSEKMLDHLKRYDNQSGDARHMNFNPRLDIAVLIEPNNGLPSAWVEVSDCYLLYED